MFNYWDRVWTMWQDWRSREEHAEVISERAYPGQRHEAAMFAYGTGQNVADYLSYYALNVWVGTAISRVAEAAAMSALKVHRRGDITDFQDNHGILDLLGEYGSPNDAQDAGEFLEEHFVNWGLTGNSYWYWVAPSGGRPVEVYNLQPAHVVVVPGVDRTVSHYEYKPVGGLDIRLEPEQVTHFKRNNPYSRYYGMSALEAIRLEITGDRSMAIWNNQFFGDDVGIPAGIIFVPPDTPAVDLPRLTDEFNASYGTRRRTAVIRGTPGSQMYHPAGAVHKDLDFGEGRLLSRQAIYECLDLPLGMLSETSTEAHARVAERQFHAAVDKRLWRTGRKLTADALHLWPAWKSYAVGFEDKRRDVADWEQGQRKVDTMLKTHSINEVRAIVYNDKPVDWGERDGNEVRDRGQNEQGGSDAESSDGGVEATGRTNGQSLNKRRERLAG